LLKDGAVAPLFRVNIVQRSSKAPRICRPTVERASIADLNRESAIALERLLPGVGEVLAANIVEHRSSFGPFESAADLAKVPKMGARRAERLWAAIETIEPDAEISESEPVAVPPPEPMPVVEDPEVLAFMSRGLVTASHAPPASHDEAVVRGAQAPEPSRRRMLARAAVVGLLALSAGVAATATLVKSARDRSAAVAKADVDDVRAEVETLRQEVQAVGSAQLGSMLERKGDSTRADALEKRIADHDKAQAETKKRVQAVEERAKKIEDKQEKQAARISKTEDDLAWQKMATAAQLAALKRQVRSAADKIEALDSAE
jgi:hypothetical protein